MTRITMLGVPIDPLDAEQTMQRIDDFIRSGGVHQHVVVNAAKIIEANRNPELAAAIAQCDLVNADGMSVVWAARLLGHPVPGRVAGIDLMEKLLARAAALGYSVYFLGAKPDVVADVVRLSSQRYPGLRVAGFRDGYWTAEAEVHVVSEVARSNAAILFLAIPSPRKEEFLAAHKSAMTVPFVMGVGGSFDVLAGRVSRAPAWMQRLGLEWLHRLRQEPRRMFKRYLVGNTKFIALTLRALISQKLRRRADVQRVDTP